MNDTINDITDYFYKVRATYITIKYKPSITRSKVWALSANQSMSSIERINPTKYITTNIQTV